MLEETKNNEFGLEERILDAEEQTEVEDTRRKLWRRAD